jgi:hypothetical protein
MCRATRTAFRLRNRSASCGKQWRTSSPRSSDFCNNGSRQESPNELGERLVALAGYVVENGPVIKDGDTVGEDADERIRVMCSPSAFGHKEQVMRLALRCRAVAHGRVRDPRRDVRPSGGRVLCRLCLAQRYGGQGERAAVPRRYPRGWHRKNRPRFEGLLTWAFPILKDIITTHDRT